MPRKQRFKPSRKPKPMPEKQAQEAAELQRSEVQRDDAARASRSERPEPTDARPQGREEAQAR